MLFWAPLLLSLTAVAAPRARHRSIDASFVYATNLKTGASYRIAIRGGDVRMGRRTIRGLDLPAAEPSLAEALRLEPTVAEASPCAAGSYTHTVKRRGKPKIERGCIGSARFTALEKAFRELDSLAR